MLSHQRLSKVSASLDRELRESLGATAPVISGLPFLLGACCASGGSVGTRPSRTRLTPPPQSWEILSLLLSPTLFFYIKCLFASNFFQVPLLLSARPWFSSTASVNPLSPLSLPRTTYRHISPGKYIHTHTHTKIYFFLEQKHRTNQNDQQNRPCYHARETRTLPLLNFRE